MAQNTSHAVMAQRREPHDSLDYFPTPPWATRAPCAHVLGDEWRNYRVWETACGEGHMARPLGEYFGTVHASDCHDYGTRGAFLHDFLMPGQPPVDADWVVTNPPFRLAAEFIRRGMEVARCGVAVLVRTTFLESAERYRSLFQPTPPATVAQFVERVPMVKGRLDAKAGTATGYAWIVWHGRQEPRPRLSTQMVWIPPCRRQLERPGDYEVGKLGEAT